MCWLEFGELDADTCCQQQVGEFAEGPEEFPDAGRAVLREQQHKKPERSPPEGQEVEETQFVVE